MLGGAVAVAGGKHAFERAETRRVEIRAGIDAEHPRHAARFVAVDAADDAVRVTAADDDGVGLPRQLDVVGIAPLSAQQARVLAARHRLTDAEFDQTLIARNVPSIHRTIPQERSSAGELGDGVTLACEPRVEARR